MDMKKYEQQVAEAAAMVQRQLPAPRPCCAIILGTGAGGLAAYLEEAATIPYETIPHFPRASAPGHVGQLRFGRLAGQPVLLFQGRVHAYEGYNLRQVTFPVRLAAALGSPILILTNAAGGLRPTFRAGDLMIIRDQINLLGDNPLVGPNIEAWGPRFPDMSHVYDQELAEMAVTTGQRLGLRLQEGVYVGVRGPSLETPAETRMLRLLGADAVGMSTVAEAIVGVHAGLRLLGISVISNVNLPDAMQPVSIDAIIAVVQQAEVSLAELLQGVVAQLPTAP
ncbi:MAG: purine-nucleoside phosphorylase [Desulfobacca sp.]|uniref:purine-nucleoside phosphorylase n=1 Tax=Desulfobacca sp. TaxID=2067990 RepID=UPI00404B13E7